MDNTDLLVSRIRKMERSLIIRNIVALTSITLNFALIFLIVFTGIRRGERDWENHLNSVRLKAAEDELRGYDLKSHGKRISTNITVGNPKKLDVTIDSELIRAECHNQLMRNGLEITNGNDYDFILYISVNSLAIDEHSFCYLVHLNIQSVKLNGLGGSIHGMTIYSDSLYGFSGTKADYVSSMTSFVSSSTIKAINILQENYISPQATVK